MRLTTSVLIKVWLSGMVQLCAVVMLLHEASLPFPHGTATSAAPRAPLEVLVGFYSPK